MRSRRNQPCQHENTENATVNVVDYNEEVVDKIPVVRCAECNEIMSLTEEEDDTYDLHPEEEGVCYHSHESVKVVRYNFYYEDGGKGESLWTTTTRICGDCNSLIERATIDLTGKPK